MRTPAVCIRAVEPVDLPAFFEHQQDPVSVEMAAFPPRERDIFLLHWRKILADETVVARTVLADGAVAGNLVSYVQAGLREVGYWLGREFWGRGVATRALGQFLQELPQRPLTAHVARHNVASRRVLENCDFVVVGDLYAGLPGAGGVDELVLRLS